MLFDPLAEPSDGFCVDVTSVYTTGEKRVVGVAGTEGGDDLGDKNLGSTVSGSRRY